MLDSGITSEAMRKTNSLRYFVADVSSLKQNLLMQTSLAWPFVRGFGEDFFGVQLASPYLHKLAFFLLFFPPLFVFFLQKKVLSPFFVVQIARKKSIIMSLHSESHLVQSRAAHIAPKIIWVCHRLNKFWMKYLDSRITLALKCIHLCMRTAHWEN